MKVASPLLSLDISNKTLAFIALGVVALVVVSAKIAQGKVLDVAAAVNPVDQDNIINRGVTSVARAVLDKPDDWQLGYWFTTPAESAEVWDIDEQAWVPAD